MFRAYRQRRALFKNASWRIFGVGQDPAGNLICRWRGGLHNTGGWIAVLPVHGAVAPVPLHWRAAALRRELAAKLPLQAAAAMGAVDATRQMHNINHGATVDGGDVAGAADETIGASATHAQRAPFPEDISAYDTRLRLSSVATYMWRLFYLACLAGTAFVFGCQYLRAKRYVSKATRKMLGEIEEKAFAMLPRWAQELLWMFGTAETVVSAAEALGYDAYLVARDVAEDAAWLAKEEKRLLQELASRRLWRFLTVLTGFATFLLAVFFYGG